MDANDSGALQLVLFKKRMMTHHKSKWIDPSQREAGICRGARARFCNRDKLYFERYTFIVNVTTKRWRYLPCYTHYRWFKLTVMDANDSGALQLVLFKKRMMTHHKSKWIDPSQREAGICRGARARFCNRDKLYFERYTFIVNVTTKRWRYLPCYTHYRWFPNSMVKFILPLHQQASIHDLLETTSVSN